MTNGLAKFIIRGTVFLAIAGLVACGNSDVDDTAAVTIATNRCMTAPGATQALCDCTIKSTISKMTPEEHAVWAKMIVATEGATSVDAAIEKSGMSKDKFIDFNSKFAGYGVSAGMQCAAKLGVK